MSKFEIIGKIIAIIGVILLEASFVWIALTIAIPVGLIFIGMFLVFDGGAIAGIYDDEEIDTEKSLKP